MKLNGTVHLSILEDNTPNPGNKSVLAATILRIAADRQRRCNWDDALPDYLAAAGLLP